MPPVAAPSPLPVVPATRRRGRRVWGRVALAGIALLFLAGIAQLFSLRFATGDVYPPYSTFRSDPLGTKAFYYSLEGLPGLRVERNLRPLRYLGEEPSAVLDHRDDDPDPAKGSGPVAVMYLGQNVFEWPFLFTEAEAQRLEALMNQGGRLVLAFLPTTVEMTSGRLESDRRKEEKARRDEKEKDAGKDKKGKAAPKPTPAASPSPATPKPSPGPSPSAPPGPTPVLTTSQKLAAKLDLTYRWNVDFRRKDLSKEKDPAKPGKQDVPAPLEEAAHPLPGLPGELKAVTWHTAVDFDLTAHDAAKAGWRALYARSGRPVIVSRPFGQAGGELILVTDPYFFSNEALNKEAHPSLLAALVGPCRRLIFEETHLGVAEEPGMMTLARRYHLGGALAALAVLAVLFLWKNMVGLLPPAVNTAVDPETGSYVSGRDSGEGFVNLLRRGVTGRDLLKTCLTQWRAANTLPGGRRPGPELNARLEEIVAAEAARPVHRRSPAAAYRAICAALKRRGGSL